MTLIAQIHIQAEVPTAILGVSTLGRFFG